MSIIKIIENVILKLFVLRHIKVISKNIKPNTSFGIRKFRIDIVPKWLIKQGYKAMSFVLYPAYTIGYNNTKKYNLIASYIQEYLQSAYKSYNFKIEKIEDTNAYFSSLTLLIEY